MVYVSAVIGLARSDVGNIVRINLDQRPSVLTWTNGLTYELRLHSGRVRMVVAIFFLLSRCPKCHTRVYLKKGCKALVPLRAVRSTKIVAGECYQVAGTISTVLRL